MALSSVARSRPHDLVEGLAWVTLRVIRPIFVATHNATGPFPIFRMDSISILCDVRRGSRDIGIAVTEGTCLGRSFDATDLEATLS